MTDRCKNITLAKTSFRPVITETANFTGGLIDQEIVDNFYRPQTKFGAR